MFQVIMLFFKIHPKIKESILRMPASTRLSAHARQELIADLFHFVKERYRMLKFTDFVCFILLFHKYCVPLHYHSNINGAKIQKHL